MNRTFVAALAVVAPTMAHAQYYPPAPAPAQPDGSAITSMQTDSNGYVTGLVQRNGTVLPFNATPPVVPLQPTINNGVLSFLAQQSNLTPGQTVTAGNVQGPPNTSNLLSYQTAAGGAGAIAMLAGKAVLTITGSAVIAAQTIKLPPSPTDGQFVRISSQVAITALVVQDAAGNTVNAGISLPALSAGGLYQYQANTWVRIA